ncbi:MAG: hypothetical protein WCI02_16035 [Planctomycetota bacterium]
MRVLIFEPQFVGHNLAYVHHIAARLVDMGCEVHLLTSERAAQSEEFSKHLADVIDSIHVSSPDSFVVRGATRGVRVNGPTAVLAMMRSLYVGLCDIRPQHVLIPFGNPIAHWAGMPNPISNWMRRHECESELILLTGKYAYPHRDLRSAIKERLALRMLAMGPWNRIHHIVPHAWEVMQRHPSRLSTISRLLPDPIDAPPRMTKREARTLLGLNASDRIVSLVGLIDRRKGIQQLLEAFEIAAPRLRPNDRLLLAGKATEETRHLLANRFRKLVEDGHVIRIDRHLSAQELWGACIASDVMTTPYPSHLYSASIVIRGAAVGVPILANSIGWMEDMVQRFGLGGTCDTNRRDVFAENLLEALDHGASYCPTADAKRFVAFHSIDNFASRISERIAERIGINSSLGMRWSDVFDEHFASKAA